MHFKRPLLLAAALLTAVSCWSGPGHAAPDKDKAVGWRRLIAEAIKHGGVETIAGNTGSYVFAGPNGLNVTFTHTLDDNEHFVCAAYILANIIVCANWDTEKLRYGTRADEHSPWVVSDVPPVAPESVPQAPLLLSLLSTFLDSAVPFDSLQCWHRRCGWDSSRGGSSHGFGHGLWGGLRR